MGRRATYKRVPVACDTCGKSFDRPENQIFARMFCCRNCFSVWSKKHMAELNRELNPSRMNLRTRQKLRNAHLDTGEGKTYTKIYSRHAHRVIAEIITGRPLRKDEVVHHIDGDKRNNDPSNLQVMTRSEHSRMHTLEYHEKKRKATT